MICKIIQQSQIAVPVFEYWKINGYSCSIFDYNIVVIQEERAEEEVEIAWDGKLKRIKKHLEEVVNDQNKLLKELENHFDSSFRSKIELKTKELESNSDRHFASLSLRVEHIDMMISKCMKEVGSNDPSENKNLLQTLTQKLKPKE